MFVSGPHIENSDESETEDDSDLDPETMLLVFLIVLYALQLIALF